MSTLLTLRSKLRAELKIDPSGRIWNDSTLNEYVNDAVSQIQSDGNFDWSMCDATHTDATAIGTSDYALPDNFVRMEGQTFLYDGGQLRPQTYNYLYVNGYFLVSGSPSYYAIRDNKVWLAATPDAIKNISFLYRKRLDEMATDAADSGMPIEFDTAIVKYAAYRAWSPIEGRENKAVASMQDYNEIMKGIFAQYLGRYQDENFQFQYETVNTTL